MAFDYKKEYKEFYMPKNKPSIVEIPKMNYIAVRGKGNPNDENGDYKNTIGLLYGVAYTIKMSYKGTRKIDGFFKYVVPPLEGFWWQENIKGMDYNRKDDMKFISIFSWACPQFVIKLWISPIISCILCIYSVLYLYIWYESSANLSSHISNIFSVLLSNLICFKYVFLCSRVLLYVFNRCR